MTAALLAGIFGGIIGALVVVLVVFWQEQRFGRLRAATEAERVTGLSYRLWRLYVDLISGTELHPKVPSALYEEVLLATSGAGGHEDSGDALLEMTSILFRAWSRASELRRVGLSVCQGQFADLTASMRGAFSSVQLGAATGKTGHRGTTGGVVTDLSAARTRKYA